MFCRWNRASGRPGRQAEYEEMEPSSERGRGAGKRRNVSLAGEPYVGEGWVLPGGESACACVPLLASDSLTKPEVAWLRDWLLDWLLGTCSSLAFLLSVGHAVRGELNNLDTDDSADLGWARRALP